MVYNRHLLYFLSFQDSFFIKKLFIIITQLLKQSSEIIKNTKKLRIKTFNL